MTMSAAEAALAVGDFPGAMRALDDGHGAGTAAWFELQANAAYGVGEFETAVGAWERLHALHRSSGAHVPAARAAVMTAMHLLCDAGLPSTVRGWVRRAQALLIGHDATPVHALIAGVSGYERFFSGDLDAAAPFAAEAIRLGDLLDVIPAVTMGRTASGRIAIMRGDVDGGLAQLDEVAALLMSGEVDDVTTGIMFCELICAAQAILRTDLAREWTEAMERWGVTAAIGAVRGRCRVHQAELLRHSGPCDAAERVALQACEELRPWLRREYGWPLVELGMVRLRRGDLAGASEMFVSAQEHCWPPHPGLALLRLESGDVAAATAAIADAIAHPVDAPSKELPPFGDLRLVPLFDAQSEIALAAGDVVAATAAATGLQRAAAQHRSPELTATAQLAAARAALLSGDAAAAAVTASSACSAFAAQEAPFDVARARVVLAAAHEAMGSATAARHELEQARIGYGRYGAVRRTSMLDERLGRVPMTGGPLIAPVERRGTLRQDGPMWTVELAGESVLVKDLKGFRYLRRLLAEPGREFHVLDLVAVETGTLRTPTSEVRGIPVLDDVAREAFRRRLADIDDDIDEATRLNDLGRIAKAEMDRQYLVNELTRGVGLGGRARLAGGSSERARTAVARSLRYALDELATRHRQAADHLRASVRTGTYCAYAPDPLAAITWRL